METTVTDTKLNIVWKKISEAACEKKKIDFSSQDMERLQRKTFALPASFIEKLRTCTPVETTKKITFFEMTASVTGVENGLCQIKMPPFDFSLWMKTGFSSNV